MGRLPDFEALAIFAKVAELKSFAAAATELRLSKATVSKAVSRLESRLKVRLLNRTSRRITLTEDGRELGIRASTIVRTSEDAEDAVLTQAGAPRGTVRLSAPMSFGNLYIAPLLPEFFARYPDITIDLQLSDATVDLVGEGFDAAIRIAALPDSSLIARTLCPMPRFVVAAPKYLTRHERPAHPLGLAAHSCIAYTGGRTSETWQFTNEHGETATVRPSGSLRTNSGDAILQALKAGLGIGVLPEFFLREAILAGQLERLLPKWHLPAGAVHWVTPPGGLRPKRVDLLSAYFAERLAASKLYRGSR